MTRLRPFLPPGWPGAAARFTAGRPVVVETGSGRVRGRRQPGMSSFTGIPYARPPLGPLRHLPPEPHPGWAGVRDTTTTAPEPPQRSTSGTVPREARHRAWDEDCLTLDVHTPATDGAGRPVLVWLHGGGFLVGSSSGAPFDPTTLVVDEDLVVVSVNYRLGVLGWLYLGHLDEAYADSGNLGLLDQLAALRWVSANVAAFGGDPGNVTVVGFSAGATSIASLLGVPESKALFHRVACHSGGATRPIGLEQAVEFTDRFLHDVRARTLAELLEQPVERLLLVQMKTSMAVADTRAAAGLASSLQHLGPMVDGRTVPRPPLVTLATGAGAPVPLTSGSTADEVAVLRTTPAPSPDELRSTMELWFGDRTSEAEEAYLEAGRGDRERAYDTFLSDRYFGVPALRLAQAQARSMAAPARHFLFTWRPPQPHYRALHGADLPLLFGVRDRRRLGAYGYQRVPPEQLYRAVQGAWSAFARTGVPEHDGLRPWPALDARGDGPSMAISVPCGPVEVSVQARLALWDGVI